MIAAPLPPLGFGGSSIGNLYQEMTDGQSRAAIRRARTLGITLFDTAPHYGLGLSERRLGRALADTPRAGYVLSTKVGRLLVPRSEPLAVDDGGFVVPGDLERRWDFSLDGVRTSLEQSCARLGVSSVDIALVHDADRAWVGAAEQGLRAVVEVARSGIAGAVGIGTMSTVGLVELLDAGGVDVLMLANRFTLLDHDAALPVLAAALRAGVAVIAAGVYASGLLATPWPAVDARYEYLPAEPDRVEKARRIAAVCDDHGVDLPTAAIAFARRHPAVATVVLGMGSPAEVDENVARSEVVVPAALWRDLSAAGLISADALAVSPDG